MNTGQISLEIILAYLYFMLAATVLNDREKEQKNAEGFFLANHGINSVLLPLTVTATMQDAFAFLGAPGMYYTYGISYIPVVLSQVWIALMVVYFGNKTRKLASENDYMSLGDYLQDRLDSKYLKMLASCTCTLMTMVFLATRYMGNARAMNIVSGDAISYPAAILTSIVFSLLYVLIGGADDVVLLDAVQTMILSVGITVAVRIAIAPVGGIQTLFTQIIDKIPELLSRPGPQGTYTGKYWITQFTVLPFGVWFCPHMWMKSLMAKDEGTLAKSAISISLSQILIHGFATLFIGFAGHLLLQPQQVRATNNVLSLLMTIRSRWLIAALVTTAAIAAGISAINTILPVSSQVVSQDLILTDGRGRISERKNMILSRMVIFITMVICGVMALNSPEMLARIVQDVAYTGLAQLMPTFLLGMYWEGCTKTRTACGTPVGIAILFGTRIMNVAPLGWSGLMWGFFTNILLTVLVSLMMRQRKLCVE